MQQRITNTLIHKKKKIQESGDLFIALNCPEPWFVSLFSFITKSLKASAFLTLKWDYYSSRPLRLLCRLNEMIPVFGTIISSNTYYLSLCFFLYYFYRLFPAFVSLQYCLLCLNSISSPIHLQNYAPRPTGIFHLWHLSCHPRRADPFLLCPLFSSLL